MLSIFDTRTDEQREQSLKAALLDYAAVGMDIKKAFMLAAVPKEYEKRLLENPDFIFTYEQKRALLEYKVLRNLVALATADIGKDSTSVEARWLLPKLNPEQWGQKVPGEGGTSYDVPLGEGYENV